MNFFAFFLIKYPKLKIKEIQNNRIYCNTNNFLNNQNLTILDLGKCEDELKEKYNINPNAPLIYLKNENISDSDKNDQIIKI